jgi:hypothetical protein
MNVLHFLGATCAALTSLVALVHIATGLIPQSFARLYAASTGILTLLAAIEGYRRVFLG